MLLPKFITTSLYHYRRQKAIQLVLERQKALHRHVYLQAFVTNNNKTEAWICIDRTKLIKVSNITNEAGFTPCVNEKDTAKLLDFFKHQYYIAHRHRLLNV